MISLPPLITDPRLPLPATCPRLIALDLDGTVVDGNLRIHPRTEAAVHAAVSAGLLVVIATGRMYRSALPWAMRLEVNAPLICYQGAVVRDLPTPSSPRLHGEPMGELLFQDALPPHIAEQVVRCAREHDWYCQAYWDEQALCEQRRPEAQLYAGVAQVSVEVVPDLLGFVERGMPKLVVVVEDAHEVDRCQNLLRDTLGTAAAVTRSQPQFVEITSPVATKGNALRRLCAHMNIDIAETVAVGDAPNDIGMLDVAGFAVAVTSAADGVIAHANALCGPPEEGGVADIFEVLGVSASA